MHRLFLVTLLFLTASCTSLGGKLVYQDNQVAIDGYDTVAYFDQNKAVSGSPEISHKYQGVSWYFSTAENRDQFAANPEKYLPAYGGYCAYAMSKGFVVSSDPEAFTIYQGKLYLNFSFSVRDTWREDIPGYLAKSEPNWIEKLADAD